MEISRVNNLLAEMRAAMAAAQSGAAAPGSEILKGGGINPSNAAQKINPATDFSNVLKSSLEGVAKMQNHAEAMQKSFVLGDDKVSLSNVMIDMQKANIAFQTTVQVRNKVIAAYNEIMNMQV